MSNGNETKHWYLSKTIMGAFLMVLVVVLRAFNRPEAGVIEQESESVLEWILQAGALVAALLAFWGRLTAKKTLTP